MKMNRLSKWVATILVLCAAIWAMAQQRQPHYECQTGVEDPGECNEDCNCPQGTHCCYAWSASAVGCNTCVLDSDLGVDACAPDSPRTVFRTCTFLICDCLWKKRIIEGHYCGCDESGTASPCSGPYTVQKPCVSSC